MLTRRHDPKNNNIQRNGIQNNETQNVDFQQNNELNVTLSIMALSKMAEHCYAECCICWQSLMLSVSYKPFMLRVIMLNAVMLSVMTAWSDLCRFYIRTALLGTNAGKLKLTHMSK